MIFYKSHFFRSYTFNTFSIVNRIHSFFKAPFGTRKMREKAKIWGKMKIDRKLDFYVLFGSHGKYDGKRRKFWMDFILHGKWNPISVKHFPTYFPQSKQLMENTKDSIFLSILFSMFQTNPKKERNCSTVLDYKYRRSNAVGSQYF